MTLIDKWYRLGYHIGYNNSRTTIPDFPSPECRGAYLDGMGDGITELGRQCQLYYYLGVTEARLGTTRRSFPTVDLACHYMKGVNLSSLEHCVSKSLDHL